MRNEYEIRGDVTVIFLQERDGKRLETLVDTDDLPKLLKYPVRWHAGYERTSSTFYVQTRTPEHRNQKTYLHRFITDAPHGMDVDHIEHDGLDNRKAMLRICTPAENLLNRSGPQRNSKSGIRGVSWHLSNKKWRAQITIRRKKYVIGDFTDIEAARVAYEQALERAKLGLKPVA